VRLFVGICFYFHFETILMRETTSEILMQFFSHLYLAVVKLGITKASS
jgi:hypothetical protein